MNWMKRISIILLVVLLAAGCSGQADGNTSGASLDGNVPDGSGSQESTQLTTGYADNALSPVSQLALGTFMLEDTDYAVDPEMAAALLPYWQLYLNMMDSDTAAKQEIDSLITGIQGVMTEEQVNYVAGLELTQTDLMSMSSQLNLTDRPSSTDSSSDQTTQRNGQGMGPDGMPEGVNPGDGGFGGGPGGGQNGGAMDPELLATMQAQRGDSSGGSGPGANRMQQPLIQAVIELLESKIAS